VHDFFIMDFKSMMNGPSSPFYVIHVHVCMWMDGWREGERGWRDVWMEVSGREYKVERRTAERQNGWVVVV